MPPPCRMDFEAKILIRSAPAATCLLALPFERFNRRQDARTRDDPFCNSIAKRNVVRRTHALHGREACHQRQPRIRCRLVCILLCCPFRTRVFSILAEDPRDVYLRVDPARQQKSASVGYSAIAVFTRTSTSPFVLLLCCRRRGRIEAVYDPWFSPKVVLARSCSIELLAEGNQGS